MKEGFDANVQIWVRASEAETGFEDRLFAFVKEWVAAIWPFERVAYPGKEIPARNGSALPSRPTRS